MDQNLHRFSGPPLQTLYSSASGSPFSISYYNSKGQLTNEIDPDLVSTLYQFNAKGELEYTITDMDQDHVIDWAGPDRITRVSNDVVTAHGVNVHRTQTFTYPDGSSTPLLLSKTEVSTDGLQSWQTICRDPSTPVLSSNRTVYAGSGNRYQTNIAPDGSYTVSAFSNGRLSWTKRFDALNSQLSSLNYSYDAHGRQNQLTDARNGTTTYTFNDADLIASVTTPNPGPLAGSAQTTLTHCDKMLRATNVIQPDGGSIISEFFLTGELKKTYGTRTYPVEYTYDYAGRMATMKTWKDFAGNSGTATNIWKYDGYRGWLTNKIYTDNHGPSYDYTDAGRLKTRLWARGLWTTNTYDNAGELSAVDYSDGTTPSLSYTYDRRGRQTQIQVGTTSTSSLIYNDANELLSESYTGGTLNGLSVTNGYDQFLRRTNLAALNGATAYTTTVYGYDSASRLNSVTNGAYNALYSYVANSPLVSQITFRSNSTTRMTTTKQYDFLNRLSSISSSSSSSSSSSFSYQYNSASQRTLCRLADGSVWLYSYDSLGQLTSAKKFWSDWTPVAGQQFEYAFDDIGNRTKSGGDEHGENFRVASYHANSLNQYTNRDVPGAVDVMGLELATNTVAVNSQTPYRKGEYFRKEISVNNSSSAVWQSVNVSAPNETAVSGYEFVPKTAETFGYDLDGNTTNDGRWYYTWDAENRLTQVESLTSGPSASKRKVIWEFDGQGRRIRQKTYDLSSGSVLTEDLKFPADGWRHIAELNAGDNSLLRSYVWGLDLSGSLDGAGGIGGLLLIKSAANGPHFFAYDGNGNVSELVSATNGAASATYEYDPFGGVLRATGFIADENRFQFSTKRCDRTTDFELYEYRTRQTLCWLNRDPAGHRGGLNLYVYARNDPSNIVDPHGQSTRSGGTEVWSQPRDVQFNDEAIGTAQVWVHASVPDYAEPIHAIWIQFNKGANAPTCKWVQFILRELYDPEGNPTEGWYNAFPLVWRRFGQRFVDTPGLADDWRYAGDLATSNPQFEAIWDQPDARKALNQNRPMSTVFADDFLLCQTACADTGKMIWAPAFRVTWKMTQRWLTGGNLEYDVTYGSSVSSLPAWARAPKWLAGFKSWDPEKSGSTPLFVTNPTWKN